MDAYSISPAICKHDVERFGGQSMAHSRSREESLIARRKKYSVSRLVCIWIRTAARRAVVAILLKKITPSGISEQQGNAERRNDHLERLLWRGLLSDRFWPRAGGHERLLRRCRTERKSVRA